MDLDRVHIVLVRTRTGRNLGAVCRAMNNCGLRRLTLVDCRTKDLSNARATAVHSTAILDAAVAVDTLAEAVKDARWVIGTCMRPLAGQRPLGPRQLALEAPARSLEGDIAIVFGDEESGLQNAELKLCHDVSAIDANPAQPSFNLAQAVLLYAWELFQQRTPDASPASIAPAGPALQHPDKGRRATAAHVEAVATLLREVLLKARFSDVDRPNNGVLELAFALRRAHLTEQEARLWTAALSRTKAALPSP